nr:MAG: ORF1 [TTV-like mini virus]
MPPFNFYRRRYYPNRWRRNRRYLRRRRPRRFIRRRFWRRRWVRRRRFYKRYKRKLKFIKLKQWQPESIKKCRIKGNLCMFTCGRGHTNHNWVLTSESYVPTSEPGGGSWSIFQITLRVLYDDYISGRNWWTGSNTNLPLARYLGGTLKFYRSEFTDYIVTIQNTGPFEVTLDTYLSTQPTRHLMNHRHFIVTKLGRGPNKKTYVKKRLRPPALFQNKWYFQQDIYNTPLTMITVTACSLDQMYAPQDQISTNITLYSLNTNLFQLTNWERKPYSIKATGTIETYLYTTHDHIELNQQPKWKQLILLGDVTNYTNGDKMQQTGISKPSDAFQVNQQNKWGNPFTKHNQSNNDPIYYGPKPKTNNDTWESNAEVSLITSLWIECRYNPFKDKGKGNKVYIVPTDSGNNSFLSLPTNSKLLITDLPLWIIFWGWTDWLLKSRPIGHLSEEWQIVIQSKYIYPTLPCYVFIDKYFRNPPEHYQTELTETDKVHWHPKYSMQTEQLEIISQTGPAAPKINNTKQIEAHLHYNFYFKWGGNPAPMETINDPAEQEKYPTPSNQLQRLEIESPGEPKEYKLYAFDEKRQQITTRAAKRLKTDYSTPQSFTEYGPKDIPLQEAVETQSSSEEEEIQTPFQDQEQLRIFLRRKKQLYKQQLRKLLKTKKYFPLT